MAVISNLNTQQTPITTGATGAQIQRLIPGPRVYIKTLDATATPVITKSNGTLPSGWTDLGIVDGNVKVTYQKETKEVRTGIDNVLRYVYVDKKTGKFEFNLSQVDDVVMQQLTGISPSMLTGSIAQFGIGQEDVVTKALLLVMQNKLDGKEITFYHPAAFLNFGIADSGDAVVVQGTADLPLFTFGAVQVEYILQIFP